MNIISFTNPDVVVHTASKINIEECEEDKEAAWEINVTATKNIVRACKNNGAKLIYISSDYIFNGDDGPYYEDSNPDPINYYGKTKLEAERIIEEELFNYAIIRPTVLDGYNSLNDSSFFNYTYKALQKNKKISLDDNLLKYPVFIDNVVKLIKYLIIDDLKGIYHIGSKESTTRFKWAGKIGEYFNLNISNLSIGKSYSDSVKRPMNVNLLTHNKYIYKNFYTQKIKQSLEIIEMQKSCSFNYFYSFDPETNYDNDNIAKLRISAGKKLAKNFPCKADIVVAIPESGIFPAVGYSDQSGIPFVPAIIRNDNVERTLFETNLENRVKMINSKLAIINELVFGKNIVLIDEAILSGTTIINIISKLKSAGVKSIHIRIPFPVVVNHCKADCMPTTGMFLAEKLTKNNKFETDITNNFVNYLKVSSVNFLSKKLLFDSFQSSSAKCIRCLKEE